MLELAHEGHPGEDEMVTRLRGKVWWPGLDERARECVKLRMVSPSIEDLMS